MEMPLGIARVEKCQFRHIHAAPLREPRRQRRFPKDTPVRKILARRSDTLDTEVPPEVILDLGSRPSLAYLTNMLDQKPEQRVRPFREIIVDRIQRRLDAFARLLR